MVQVLNDSIASYRIVLIDIEGLRTKIMIESTKISFIKKKNRASVENSEIKIST